MDINRYVVFIATVILCITKSIAQDAHFSQFYAAPLFLSPSLAGSSGGTRLVTNYRNQWPGIEKSFQTYALSADFYLDKYRSGIGVLLVTDKQGAANLNNTYMGLQYSYRIKLNKFWQIVPGLKFSVGHESLDRNKLLFVDQIETGSTSNAQTYLQDSKYSYYDFASSLFFYSSNYWIGLGAEHFVNANNSFTNSQSNQTLKIVNFGGMNLWSKENFRDAETKAISFCYLFEYQNNFKQLDLEIYWYARFLDLGLWYRGIPVFKNKNNLLWDNDALIFLIGVTKGPFHIGYSYDLQLSKLAGCSSGAHELSITYEFGNFLGKNHFECFSQYRGMRYNGIRFNKDQPRDMKIY